MSIAILVLMILAVVFLLMQAFQINVRNVEIGWLGLMCWAMAVLLPMLWHLGVLLLVIVVLLVFLLLVTLVRTRPAWW
jgi:hypothetical protein